MPLATEREAGHGARAAAAVGSAAATSRAALRTFADLHAIADGAARATGATRRCRPPLLCSSDPLRRIALGAAAEAGGDSVRVSVVGRGPLPIGSLRARAAAARLGGSGRPAGGCP